MCRLAIIGELPLTYVVEHKPLIERVRSYHPSFQPLPCDYYSDGDEYDDYEEYSGYEEEEDGNYYDGLSDADESCPYPDYE